MEKEILEQKAKMLEEVMKRQVLRAHEAKETGHAFRHSKITER